MSDATGNEGAGPVSERPAGPYWEDPVYRYLSRHHRTAVDNADDTGAAQFLELMEQLVSGSMPDDVYWELDTEAKADRKRQKQIRKQQQKAPRVHTSADEQTPPVNVAELKRRIFSPNVSRENVIKALEALPGTERKATIAGLPPGLRRKLGEYLKSERR